MSDPEKTKATTQALYNLMFNQCRPAEAINQQAGDTNFQHKPHLADGKPAFTDYFERSVEACW